MLQNIPSEGGRGDRGCGQEYRNRDFVSNSYIQTHWRFSTGLYRTIAFIETRSCVVKL